jgi:hypothetical protein
VENILHDVVVVVGMGGEETKRYNMIKASSKETDMRK